MSNEDIIGMISKCIIKWEPPLKLIREHFLLHCFKLLNPREVNLVETDSENYRAKKKPYSRIITTTLGIENNYK